MALGSTHMHFHPIVRISLSNSILVRPHRYCENCRIWEVIMGSATVLELEEAQAREEYEQLLERFDGAPLAHIERLAAADVLTADEYRALRRIRMLEWLLAR